MDWGARSKKLLITVSSLLVGVISIGPAPAQDPFADDGGASIPPARGEPSALPPLFAEGSPILGIALTAEWLETDLAKLPKLLREHGGKASSLELYQELHSQIEAGEGRSLEVVYGRFPIGNRGKVQSVDELIYATEYDPPEIPNSVTVDGAGAVEQVPRTPATPAAFETRNVGTAIEADSKLEGGHQIVLTMAAERVSYLGRDYHLPEKLDGERGGLEVIWMPKFHAMSVNTTVLIESGSTVLLGTFTPPADLAEPGKRWLLFISAELIKTADEAVGEEAGK